MKNKKIKIDPLLEELDKKFDDGDQNKRSAEQNALININFINGKQYIRFNNLTNVLEEIPLEDKKFYREREVFNKIRPLRNTIISHIRDKIPVPHAVPLTQDQEDIDAAKATSAMLHDLFRRQHVVKKLRKISNNLVDIGPGFIHVKWNDKIGKPVISDVNTLLGDQSVLFSLEEKEKILSKITKDGKLMSGDVEFEYVSMYEIYVADPSEQDINEQQWVIRAKTYNKEEAEAIFGTKFKTSETVGVLTNRPSGGNTLLETNLGMWRNVEADDQVIIKEYFEKPTSKHPNGRHILFGGGVIISSGELPYINGEFEERIYPFIKFGLDTPGEFYSHPFIEDVKSIQRRYNQLRNRKYEYVVKNVHGQLAIEEGALSDDEKVTNNPGDILWYKRGYRPPTTITSAGTGTLDVDSELRTLDGEFTSTTGVSSLSMNGTPSSSAVRGSTMAQMLMEVDQSKMGLIVDSMSSGVIEMAQHAVRLYKQFIKKDEVRFSRFTNELGTIVDWHKDLLVEDIEIKNRAKLTTTESRRKQDVQELLRSGLLDPNGPLGAATTIKIIEEMDLGIAVNEIPIKGQADIKKARRENILIINSLAQVDADTIDDHSIHYEIHSDFMKSDEYRKMVIVNPEIDVAMRYHLQQHEKIINDRNMEARAEAIAKANK